ncbi:MAG: hypothetical protein K2X55_28485 [Burkholderiaceae bacterium]|nr:hypothetical protein [Burkholderiaceae bacterium]
MQALQQIASDGVVEKLNLLRSEGKFLAKTDFLWKQLQRDGQKLIHADPAIGWAIMGMIHTMTGDVDEVDACFSKSLRIAEHFDSRLNWLTAMSTLGFHTRAHGMYMEIGAPTGGGFTEAVQIGIDIGAFHMIQQNIEMAHKLGIDVSHLPVLDLDEVVQIINEAGITDADIARHMDAAGCVLRERGLLEVKSPQILKSRSEAGGFTGVTIMLYVKGGPKDILSYNKALARREREMEIKKDVAFDVVIAGVQ